MVQLESWFEELSPGEVLIAGTRVDVATIADEYRAGVSAEEIAVAYPSVSLTQVYAAILYYLTRREVFDDAERGSGADLLPEPPAMARIRAQLAARSQAGSIAP